MKPPLNRRVLVVGYDAATGLGNTFETRTLYADTNRSQVVYHANYLRYFEFGRASLMRDAALRVWSAKEAAAKTAGIDLADAWEPFRVVEATAAKSRLESNTGQPLTAIHATLDGHLFSLLTVESVL